MRLLSMLLTTRRQHQHPHQLQLHQHQHQHQHGDHGDHDDHDDHDDHGDLVTHPRTSIANSTNANGGSGDLDIMSYLYNAQTRGLVGLWQKVCRAELPSRCDRRWFFTSFCGLSAAEWDSATADARANASGTDAKSNSDSDSTCELRPSSRARVLASLTAADDIEPHLKGTIKPYDVVSFMTLLDGAREVFDFDAAAVDVRSGRTGETTRHHFFLERAQAPDTRKVEALLRSVYGHIQQQH